jgi:hypothetical protein
VSTADAVTREVAWLCTSGDSLPALLKAQGGPFDVVQGYWPRTAPKNTRALYLVRTLIHDQRSANVRSMATYTFAARLLWPMLSSAGNAEAEQQALDNAIDKVIGRVQGPLFDKTHGNRFLSVAENPAYITVQITDPEQALGTDRVLRAEVGYSADDFEISN